MKSRFSTRANPLPRTLAALMLLLPLGGCAAVAFMAATLAPPPEVEAKYELPEGKRVLVFPDDQTAPVGYPPFKKMLATRLSEELVKHELATETVPYERIVDLQIAKPDFDRLPVDEIGRALGADLVIFLQMGEFRLKDAPEDPLWRGRTTVYVRVVDAKEGKRLWPETPREGHAITLETDVSDREDAGYGVFLTEQMANNLADQIAKLFYTHREQAQ